MKTSSASVLKHTGKTWDEWYALFEKKGAHLLSHKEMAAWLKRSYGLTPWWQHIVANGYEQKIGRKVEGRNARGLYSVAGNRTCAMSAASAWKKLCANTSLWLGADIDVRAGVQFENSFGAFGEIRTVRDKQIRFRWQDPEWERPSVCVVAIRARDRGKCSIGFSHDDLPSERVKEEFRKYWKSVLDRFVEK